MTMSLVNMLYYKILTSTCLIYGACELILNICLTSICYAKIIKSRTVVLCFLFLFILIKILQLDIMEIELERVDYDLYSIQI